MTIHYGFVWCAPASRRMVGSACPALVVVSPEEGVGVRGPHLGERCEGLLLVDHLRVVT